ncbi:MAG: hypothetical protein DRR06_18795 [Gammaproteobacteria bacterium]|nr:MAG: hypothetical protein DRR06_18795 [Gammaproteobacteria bacterium]
MRTNYNRGRDTEYHCQSDLEEIGYVTMRAAGSKGKTDVLAWNEHVYRHIQTKSFIKRPGDFSADIIQIRSLLLPPSGRRELWVWQFRVGWWLKIQIGPTQKEDLVLPLAEQDASGAGANDALAIGADWRFYLFDQQLQKAEEHPVARPGKRGKDSGRTHGTASAITRIHTQELRALWRDIRDPDKGEGPALLPDQVPEQRS